VKESYIWSAITQTDTDNGGTEKNAHLLRLDWRDLDESSGDQYRLNNVEEIVDMIAMNANY